MRQATVGMREARRVAALLAESHPAKIIVFGSVAKGRAHRDSDIDLCILFDDLAGRPRVRTQQDMFRLLTAQNYDFPVDIDVRVYELGEFQDRLAQGDPFMRDIADGEVLYEHA